MYLLNIKNILIELAFGMGLFYFWFFFSETRLQTQPLFLSATIKKQWKARTCLSWLQENYSTASKSQGKIPTSCKFSNANSKVPSYFAVCQVNTETALNLFPLTNAVPSNSCAPVPGAWRARRTLLLCKATDKRRSSSCVLQQWVPNLTSSKTKIAN